MGLTLLRNVFMLSYRMSVKSNTSIMLTEKRQVCSWLPDLWSSAHHVSVERCGYFCHSSSIRVALEYSEPPPGRIQRSLTIVCRWVNVV